MITLSSIRNVFGRYKVMPAAKSSKKEKHDEAKKHEEPPKRDYSTREWTV